jgi:hypothetical protein
MNEEISEVVSSFRSNSILQKKVLDEIAICPGHPNLRLILLDNVVIDTISMPQPGVTDADARQAICNWYVESGVTVTTTMNISFLADIQRCQEVVQHNFMLEHFVNVRCTFGRTSYCSPSTNLLHFSDFKMVSKLTLASCDFARPTSDDVDFPFTFRATSSFFAKTAGWFISWLVFLELL